MLGAFFLRVLAIGTFTFGGGYAMVSALQQDLVTRHGWLTPGEFSNGVAVGQVTPGPLMIMIAFLGYKIAGVWGALLGTVGLFAPSFVAVLVLSRYYQRFKASPRLEAALKGVSAAVAGLLAAASVDLARTALGHPATIIIAAASAALIAGTRRLDPGWVLLASGVAGALLLR